jgi:hypothetical protein
LAVTLINTESLHPLFVHIKIYVPAAVNPDTVVVGDVLLTYVSAAGLPAARDHVPVPVAARTVDVY